MRVVEGKGDNKARIIMGGDLFSVLDRHHDLRPSREGIPHVIRNQSGMGYTLSGFESVWSARMKKAMKKGLITEWFTFHDIRAKHATDKDENELNAQLSLGHTDKATTARYIRHPKGRKVTPLPSIPVRRPLEDRKSDNITR